MNIRSKYPVHAIKVCGEKMVHTEEDMLVEIDQSIQRLPMGCMVRGSNLGGGGEISRTLSDRPWCAPSVPGLSRGYGGRGVSLTTHPYLAPRLKKE